MWTGTLGDLGLSKKTRSSMTWRIMASSKHPTMPTIVVAAAT